MKVFRLTKIAIDACITDICDAIEKLEPLHHKLADSLRAYLGFVAVLKRANDGADKLLDAILAERTLPERDLDGAPKLFPVEGRAPCRCA